MQNATSEDELANYGNNAAVMVPVFRIDSKYLIAGQVDFIHAERTQAEIQMQIKETFLDMTQLGNSAALNGSKTTSAPFLETIVMVLFSHRAALDLLSGCFKRWSRSDKHTNARVQFQYRAIQNEHFWKFWGSICILNVSFFWTWTMRNIAAEKLGIPYRILRRIAYNEKRFHVYCTAIYGWLCKENLKIKSFVLSHFSIPLSSSSSFIYIRTQTLVQSFYLRYQTLPFVSLSNQHKFLMRGEPDTTIAI